jgi:pseudouridine synthase
MVRLQRLLAAAGIASRRASERLILEGRVTVNGTPAVTLGVKVDPERDEVRVDGKLVKSPARKTYLLLHKPPGALCTRRDPRGRPTVYDLLPAEVRGLVRSVGRLDRDSEGLLIFTDDGELLFRLTHPRFEVPKVYDVTCAGVLTPDRQAVLQHGVSLEDGMAVPTAVEVVEQAPAQVRLRLTMHEGRKREVRRMMDAVGCPVRRLVRRSMGPLKLGKLPSGRWRRLSREEIAALREAAGLAGTADHA